MISQRDKNKLIILGIVLALIAFALTVHFGMSLIPWYVIAAIAIATQVFFYVPKVSAGYYRLNDHEPAPALLRHIPLWNEIQILSPGFAYASLAAAVIVVVALLLTQTPLSVIESLFGMPSAIAWGYNSMAVFIILLVLANFVLGFGLCKVLRNVNFMLSDCIGEPVWKLECVFYIVTLIPFFRVCSFALLNNKINTLLNFGYGKADVPKFVEQERGRRDA